MAEPTLQEVFGANATQDATTITIDKTDLASVGLTASATNTSESLFAAIIANASQNLTEATMDTNPDQSIYLEDGLPSFIQRNDSSFRQQSKIIYFEKPDTQTDFDPDDY